MDAQEQQKVREFEKKLVLSILQNLKTGKLAAKDAKALASEYLQLKFNNTSELLEQLKILGQKYSLVTMVSASLVESEDNTHTQGVLQDVEPLLKSGNLEDALQKLKEGSV